MIEIKNLTKMYDQESGINNLTLTLNQGVFGLLGANGSGKSTLLKIIANLTPFNNGEIKINGKNINIKTFNLERIAFVGAENYLPNNVEVFKIFEWTKKLNKNRNNYFDEVAQMLDINIYSPKYIRELSTGMIQKIKICLAFGYERDIYLLDEITLGLDPISAFEILNFLRKVSKDKLIIYSSHNLNEIESICDEVIVLKQNTIKDRFKVSSKSKIFKNYKEIYQN